MNTLPSQFCGLLSEAHFSLIPSRVLICEQHDWAGAGEDGRHWALGGHQRDTDPPVSQTPSRSFLMSCWGHLTAEPPEQKSNTRCITCEFYQTFKRVNTCFSQTIPKTRRGRNASKFLLVANITRYQYRQRHHLKKKKKNCRSVSLVIIDTQILNKILAN